MAESELTPRASGITDTNVRASGAETSGGREHRWFSHQPDVTGEGIIAGYSSRFWILVILLGAITGVAASALIALLNLVERIAYGHGGAGFLVAVSATPGWRHLAALLTAAVIVIVGLRVLGRLPTSGGTEVSEALWLRSGRMAFVPEGCSRS
jgi:hypothetical protein